MDKNPHWVRLCQTNQAYFAAWEAGKGPGQLRSEADRAAYAQRVLERLERYRALWLEVHTKKDPTPEWFCDWVSRVPNSGCGCLDSLRDYIKRNPPRFDDWFAYTVELHNAVNAKLKKPQLSIDEALTLY
jgi:hypothetical protein